MASTPPATPRRTDLIFIVRIRDNLVIDRRRAPLPTGFIAAPGTVFVVGSSDTDLSVIPNQFTWDGNDPATFTELQLSDSGTPGTPPERIAVLEEIISSAADEIQGIKAAMGIV